MGLTQALLIGVVILAIVFVCTHLRPLNADEVANLAAQRRSKSVRRYFWFTNNQSIPNPEFKKRMQPKGEFYYVDLPLSEFPSAVAALLKYKKHEWVVIGLEREWRIRLIWMNKGIDRSSVCPPLPETLCELAKQQGYKSLLTLHNHPNVNPALYDCTKPSEQDLRSASFYAQIASEHGINLLEFICERGKHYEYFFSAAAAFQPVAGFISDIDTVNGASKLRNLALHCERVFGRFRGA